jgi:S-DNA-T family DNA segregation ATPase FtsK/SpoIIIE
MSAGGGSDDDDPLYNEIVDFCIESGKVSASLLQRRFRLGYNRAARIVDLLEERGIIGPANGSKPREVLVKIDGNHEGE